MESPVVGLSRLGRIHTTLSREIVLPLYTIVPDRRCPRKVLNSSCSTQNRGWDPATNPLSWIPDTGTTYMPSVTLNLGQQSISPIQTAFFVGRSVEHQSSPE